MIPTPSSAPVRTRTGAGGRIGQTASGSAWARHHRGLQTLLTLLGAVFLLLTWSTGASAHAELQTTTPANGAVLAQGPATVTLQFTEGVQVRPDGLRVLAADGTRVDLEDAAPSPANPNRVAVTLRSGLRDGTYTVAWRAASADSHPIHGASTFTVGAPGSGTGLLAGADQGSDPVVSALVVLSRSAGYAGLALLIGATGIVALLAEGANPRRPRKLARAGAVTIFFSAVLSLLAQGPYAAGSGHNLLDPDLLRETLAERPGLAMLARVLLAAVLTLPALIRPRTPMPTTPRRARARAAQALLPAVALAATFSAAGHAMSGHQIPLAVTADILHLTAMGLWLGGLVTLGVLCVRPDAPGPLGTTIRRFSTLAAWCVAVLVVTGVYQATRQVGTLADLLTTQYGRLLTGKVVVVLLMIGLGHTARRWTQRHAHAATAPKPAALHRMRRTVALEAAIGVVVLALSALLAGSAPPHKQSVTPPTATNAATVTLEAHYDTGTGVEGTGTVRVGFVRKAAGTYDMDLRVTGPSEAPIAPAEITATWSLPAHDLGPLPVALIEKETGHWQAEAYLAPAGTWTLNVKIRTSDFDEDTVTFATSNAALDAPARPADRGAEAPPHGSDRTHSTPRPHPFTRTATPAYLCCHRPTA